LDTGRDSNLFERKTSVRKIGSEKLKWPASLEKGCSYRDGDALNANELRWRDAGVFDFEAQFNGFLEAIRGA
jgi:hypothetical protein